RMRAARPSREHMQGRQTGWTGERDEDSMPGSNHTDGTSSTGSLSGQSVAAQAADEASTQGTRGTTPSTEEQILAARVGAVVPLNGPIHISEYDPAWPKLYAREAERITAALGNQVLLLEHVGSTSVPGLAAKPRIDILLVVPRSADEPSYCP